MPPVKKTATLLLSFILATVVVCIANFVLQIILIFTDIVTRMSTSSVMVIVLWLVTGVFGAVFTVAGAEQLSGGKKDIYKQAGNLVLVASLLAIALAVFFLSRGHFRRDPKEFSLLFSNGYVFISYFTGAAGMSLILRKLDT